MATRRVLLLLTLLMVRSAMAQGLATAEDAAQKWGLKQMSHMLADRPVMKTFLIGGQTHWVTREDTIWKWMAERYAGKATGFHAAWHEAPPTVSDAMHAYGEDKVYIYAELPKVSAKHDHNHAFERLWNVVVFELLNMENAQDFQNADALARSGSLGRMEYILKYAELEHRALGKTQAFFKDVWLPWCGTSGFKSDPRVWQQGYHPVFVNWVRQYPPDSWYPWQFYGKWFDEIKQAQKAKEQAAQP
ncbi:MAG: hypothetical protein ACO1TE_21705 [Prosthecobacter sp.]